MNFNYIVNHKTEKCVSIYGKIVNPKTGKHISIYGKIGQKILKKYLHYLNGGKEGNKKKKKEYILDFRGGANQPEAMKEPSEVIKELFDNCL